MGGLPKQAINAIRSVAFMLEEMEDTQIHESLRTALDTQMTEFTSDMKLLIEDAKEKINDNIRTAEERIHNMAAQPSTQPGHPANSYASALINAPAHANPKIAAKEGIRARQYLIEGIRNSKFSHYDNLQLKKELNDFLSDLDHHSGKILYHFVQFDRSQVTGPPVLTKCHTCPGSQVPLTKPSGGREKLQ
jgi:hypothetical protein